MGFFRDFVALTRAKHVQTVMKMAGCFFLLFTAYNGCQNIESSINAKLGYWSIATVYLALCLGAFVSAPFVLRFGVRASLAVSSSMYALFMFSNFFASYEVKYIYFVYPTLYSSHSLLVFSKVMIPAAFLNGFFAAVLWTAQGSGICPLDIFIVSVVLIAFPRQ